MTEIGKREVSSTGRLSRVFTRCAYLTSNVYGCVFVPPTAALPPDCTEPDMRRFYKSGDIVHFIATPQTGEIKNNCSWIATKVVVSSNNDTYQNPVVAAHLLDQPSVIMNQLGIVMHVNDTFAFLMADECGQVFLPGGAYEQSAGEPPRLSVCLSEGDIMLFDARPQSEQNGCKWLALHARKYNSVISSLSPSSPPKRFQGYAVVQMVGPNGAVGLSDMHGMIYCPVLTWSGPDGDSLDQVVKVGDKVHYRAVEKESVQLQVECKFRATQWGCPVSSNQQQNTGVKQMRHAQVQTYETADDMLIRALKTAHPDLYQMVRQRMPHLLAFAQ